MNVEHDYKIKTQTTTNKIALCLARTISELIRVYLIFRGAEHTELLLKSLGAASLRAGPLSPGTKKNPLNILSIFQTILNLLQTF